MPYTIREATPDDAPALADLSTELGYPSAPADLVRRLAHLAAQPGHRVLVAVSETGAVVGWVHVFAAYRVESDAFAEIAGLVVSEMLRGAGVGRMLVEAAEGWARTAGFAHVRVRSNVVREATHRFYERLGFEGAKTQRVLTKPLTV